MTFWNSIGDIIWYFLLVTAFVAYFFVLFAVLADIFRDHTLNGWGKALWVLAVIALPFLSVLIYLIARGKGMAERSARRYQKEYHPSGEDYIREVAATGGSAADEIRKAKILYDDDMITLVEYNTLKAQALGGKPITVDGTPAAMNGTPVT
jgi:hypothetical protein